MYTLSLATQIVATCGLAAFAGFLLTVALTLVPYWKGLSAEVFLTTFGRFEQPLQTTVGTTLLPGLLGVAGSILLTWRDPGIPWLWLTAAGCLVMVLALTGFYFLPANSAFTERQVPPAEVTQALDTWSRFHNLRALLAFAAAVFGAIALSQARSLP